MKNQLNRRNSTLFFLLTVCCISFIVVFTGCERKTEPIVPEPAGELVHRFDWAAHGGGQKHDQGYGIAVGSDNSLYIAGFFETSARFGDTVLNAAGGSGYDIFIIKCSQSGNIDWAKRAGGTGLDEGLSIAVDRWDNIYMTGYFQGDADFGGTTLTANGGSDMFLAKYTRAGNLVWVTQAGGTGEDRGDSVAVNDDGHVFVTGSFSGSAGFGNINLDSAGLADIFVARCDSDGGFAWVKSAGSASFDRGKAIAADTGGFIYVTGYFQSTCSFDGVTVTSAGDRDIFTARFDIDGNVQWVRSAGGPYWDYGLAITWAPGNQIYLTGFFFDTARFQGTQLTAASQNDMFLAKYDHTGNLDWVKQAGGTSYDRGKGVVCDNSGNVYVTGHFKTETRFENTSLTAYGLYDIFIAKYDAAGQFKWVRQAGGDDYSEGCAIAADHNGAIVITGAYSNNNQPARFGDFTFNGQYYDVFVAKIVEE